MATIKRQARLATKVCGSWWEAKNEAEKHLRRPPVIDYREERPSGEIFVRFRAKFDDKCSDKFEALFPNN
ncbi:hypothetical protein [Chitinophaga sp. sic0106]|uniref:hypothetical protein n=1 Tax=Chitinophaga sp. sic0106 TaxID=2854785 RepID=UPI001C45CF85|nr:hypothetical protein [Chitinophaga sp. sic0106]MBV7531311.1 hypothetical protein [Chitinophaga sp. sic0106]